MLNVLIPLSGKNSFEVSNLNSFPRILTEVEGKLLIERAAQPFKQLSMDKSITVAVPKQEAEKYQLEKVVTLLGSDFQTCIINGNTQGAACSALLAIETFELDEPLIIASFEQVMDFDISSLIQDFIDEGVDAGVLTFEAIHPKWSYVKTNKQGYVTQAAEKMPISKQAIAGLYYYKTAHSFVEAAKSMIQKDVKTNGSFYISPTLNEIILNKGIVKSLSIDKNKYFHISDEHALESFEVRISEERDNLKARLVERTKNYVEAFNNKKISEVGEFFSLNFVLEDPAIRCEGRDNVIDYIEAIFNSHDTLSFCALNIFITDNLESIIEFKLTLGDKTLVGTDVIRWDNDLNMISMNAYLYEKTDG
ncbi:nuclear transport factor 2 family protein [Vibrio tetraodonis]|uniref:nuclear transport factor 2 family protein n=1 Tax=Vibrio tetraodonis TaxID=2231647 RepID=UPI000E0B6D77|nr:nuclear transport factor 2 family protein [Vibrio tetraodonis]